MSSQKNTQHDDFDSFWSELIEKSKWAKDADVPSSNTQSFQNLNILE